MPVSGQLKAHLCAAGVQLGGAVQEVLVLSPGHHGLRKLAEDTEGNMSCLPGEGGSLSCIKSISELFDSVVLTRETEDALFIQAVLFDELHTLLHQDRHHPAFRGLSMDLGECGEPRPEPPSPGSTLLDRAAKHHKKAAAKRVGEPAWGRRALGGGPLQRWQQALLRQVSLQGVEDVELLIHAEGQELLDHLGGVWAPERRENIIVQPPSKTTSTQLNYCYNARGNRQLAPRELPPPNALDARLKWSSA
ncbi:hypothetical protein EYF80_012143 [Liparis tanakae]|uniref:Uncharacterized protein n=1 Tax=Liparis tanakae TaxID=230148 RepID=A0A4Z2IK62_9TELE|nr:hypothetical protein EYF80_012143 [Liparis tanakae]